MRIFFSAGESSGDIHGANLIRALKAVEPGLECEGLGGREMAAAGMALRHDLAGKAVMGFREVLVSLRAIRRVLLDTAAHLERTKPDCLVVIDYPDFNLRLAQRAHRAGIPVIYYIAPQIWAWRRGRLKTIAEVVDKVLVILPFEEALYREAGVDCAYVGHPLLDRIKPETSDGSDRSDGSDGSLTIGLLPGSRRQEIARLLGVMLEVADGIRKVYPAARFLVPCINEGRRRQVLELAGNFPITATVGNLNEVAKTARLCLVASGTATLEAALYGVPLVILYKTGAVNYWIAKSLVRVTHIGLANILAGRGIVPEFIQGQARVEEILPVALDLIPDTPRRKQMIADLAEVRHNLGAAGASARAARDILNKLHATKSATEPKHA